MYHDFLSKLFVITITRNFVRKFFVSQKFSSKEKNFGHVWGVSRFLGNLFLSYSIEKLRRGDSCVSELLWTQNFLDCSGVLILWKFFCVTLPKGSWETLVFLKYYCMEKNYG